MKKLIAIVLLLCILLSTTGCASILFSTLGDIAEEYADNAPTGTEEMPNDSLTLTEELVTDVSAEVSPLAGVFEDGVYVNEFLGLTCAPDESWTLLNTEEMAAVFGYSLDMFSDDAIRETAESNGSLMIFDAICDDGLRSVNITLSGGMSYGSYSASESDLIEAMLPIMSEQLALAGMEIIELESTTVEFLGEEHTCIRFSASVNGYDIYETQVIVCMDEYMFTITAASFYGDEGAELLSIFSPIK